MEMGFPRDNVASALAAANWNEEAALNILLGIAPQPAPQSAGPGMHPPGAVPAVAAPTQQPGASNPANPSHKSSGMFGFTWGKKG
jgi:hypothetical protein